MILMIFGGAPEIILGGGSSDDFLMNRSKQISFLFQLLTSGRSFFFFSLTSNVRDRRGLVIRRVSFSKEGVSLNSARNIIADPGWGGVPRGSLF